MQSQNISQYLKLPAYQYAAASEFISWICLCHYIVIALVLLLFWKHKINTSDQGFI